MYKQYLQTKRIRKIKKTIICKTKSFIINNHYTDPKTLGFFFLEIKYFLIALGYEHAVEQGHVIIVYAKIKYIQIDITDDDTLHVTIDWLYFGVTDCLEYLVQRASDNP